MGMVAWEEWFSVPLSTIHCRHQLQQRVVAHALALALVSARFQCQRILALQSVHSQMLSILSCICIDLYTLLQCLMPMMQAASLIHQISPHSWLCQWDRHNVCKT